MDGFSYVNIFDTKGIEYIVIIIFLLLLIPFWVILNRKKEITTELRKALLFLSAKIKSSPQGLYYTGQHTWTFMERSGAATMGVDNLLVHVTGEVRVNYLKRPEDLIRKGELVAEMDHQGKRLGIFSPISGKILKANDLLTEDPGIVQLDPYEKGWLYAIKPTDWKAETQDYFMADEAKNWLSREMERLRDFLAVKLAKYAPEQSHVVLQDGGELSESLLAEMPEEMWLDFQKEFLEPR